MLDAHQLSNDASSLITQGKYKQGMTTLVPALRLARQLGAAAETATASRRASIKNGISSYSDEDNAGTTSYETASCNHATASTFRLIFSGPDESCSSQEIRTSDSSSPGRSTSASKSSPFLGNVFQLPLFVQMKTIATHRSASSADDALTEPIPLTHDDLDSSRSNTSNTPGSCTSPTVDDVHLLTLTIIYNLALSMHLQALRGNDETTPIDQSLGSKALALYQHAHTLLFQCTSSTKWNETKTLTVLGLALMMNIASISRMLGMEEDVMGSYHRAFSMLLWAERDSDNQDAQQDTRDCNYMNDMYKSYLDLFYTHLIWELAGGGCCAACA